jgi:hypothetical protein
MIDDTAMMKAMGRPAKAETADAIRVKIRSIIALHPAFHDCA